MVVKSAYGAAAEEMGELFADYLDGDAARPTIVISLETLPPLARDALEKSMGAFGYPSDSCTYVTLRAADTTVEGGDIELDPEALFLLIEGLDPLFVVAADKRSAETLARAYRAAFDIDVATRIMGRPVAVFEDLPRLLATERGKHTAWNVLKSFS